MSFEDITKVNKNPAKNIPQSEQIGTEDTQLAKPVETADTIFRKPEKSPERKGPGVVVHPKTEKEEFLERLSMYDEKEEEEEKKDIRAQISRHEEPAPFLEKEVSEEAKQERFLEDLIIILKEKMNADVERDEVGDILESDKNIYDKIKTLLVISRAKNFNNLQIKKDIFDKVYDFLAEDYKKKKRKVLDEIAEINTDRNEKNRLAAQIINPIEQEYKNRLTDFKNEYLGLDLQLTKTDRKEFDALENKNPTELSGEELEKLKKLKEKIRIMKELEEI